MFKYVRGSAQRGITCLHRQAWAYRWETFFPICHVPNVSALKESMKMGSKKTTPAPFLNDFCMFATFDADVCPTMVEKGL